jgi:hypothetical protein
MRKGPLNLLPEHMLALEGRLTGKQLKESDSQGINIRTMINVFTLNLFG